MTDAKWHQPLLDRAQDMPDRPAFSDTLGTAWTWGQTAAAARAAVELLRSLGVGPGDRVILVTENSNAAVALLDMTPVKRAATRKSRLSTACGP